MSDPNKGRIAIKFGSATSKPKPSPQSSLGKRPRSTNHFGGDESDSDDNEGRYRGKHEAITGFGEDGAAETERSKRAAEAKAQKKEYVIARVPNRDWKAEVKGQARNKNGASASNNSNSNNNVETEPADQDKGLKWGLSVKEKKEPAPEAAEEEDAQPADEPEAPQPQARTADDEAMDALLGKTRKEERTIPAVSEDDAYKRDVDAAGAASTLEDYEAMPVEEFGAALLRGMGWDGTATGPKVKEVRRRQNRLGLGAKELDGAEDLGGWNQKGGKGGRPGQSRPPRLADYRREEEKKKEERRRGGGREDSYKRERERERERERDGGSRRQRDDRDRDRDRDRERDRDRRDRHRDYDRGRRR